MYNIDLYSYWKKPFTRSKKFTIHPLDEPGKEKYYSDQSHCTHYLKRTDPFVFKSILGVDYETLVRQQKEDIAIMGRVKDASTINQEELNKNNELNKKQEKEYQTGANVNLYEENKKNQLKKDYILNNNPFNSCRKLKQQKSASSTNIRPYNKIKTFKDIYGYDNITSFRSNGEKYLYSIDNMKKNNIENEPLAPKRYDGFTAFDAPVIERNKIPSSLFQSYNDKMGHTLKCINDSKGARKAMNEDEMRNNLFNQTSKEFLRYNHLPDIIKIADSRQVIRRQKIGLSKEMGEKYNPYSLIAPSKNRTGRNYVGDLFKH
jgi:hypothetical protein